MIRQGSISTSISVSVSACWSLSQLSIRNNLQLTPVLFNQSCRSLNNIRSWSVSWKNDLTLHNLVLWHDPDFCYLKCLISASPSRLCRNGHQPFCLSEARMSFPYTSQLDSGHTMTEVLTDNLGGQGKDPWTSSTDS